VSQGLVDERMSRAGVHQGGSGRVADVGDQLQSRVRPDAGDGRQRYLQVIVGLTAGRRVVVGRQLEEVDALAGAVLEMVAGELLWAIETKAVDAALGHLLRRQAFESLVWSGRRLGRDAG